MKVIPWQEFYSIEERMSYALPEKVLNILNQLSLDVGVPPNLASLSSDNNLSQRIHCFIQDDSNGGPHELPIRSPNRSHHQNRRDTGTTGNYGLNGNSKGSGRNGPALKSKTTKEKEEADWESLRKPSDFKTTKIERKVGIEKIINEIRITLNKLTDKNYAKLRDEIFEKIRSICGMENPPETDTDKDTDKEESYPLVSHTLFEIASTNKFFSKIYAQLYSELMTEFSVYSDIVLDFSKKFMLQVNKIQYVNPDTDYDGYCSYVKDQDIRRATASFMFYLSSIVMEKEVADCLWTEIQNIMITLTENIEKEMDQTGKTNEIEEMVEILFLLVTGGGKEILPGKAIDMGLRDRWRNISQQKVKEHPSWSSRALFKMGDLVKNGRFA